ncbi:DUF1249 domain-containing protein [Kangiella sp. M94]
MPLARKYVPDLKEFMALCASNYLKLNKLIGSAGESLCHEFDGIYLSVEKQPDVTITLEQMSRYTATYRLSQYCDSSAPYAAAVNREFLVRLYHDAQMAEVLSGLNEGMLPPVYIYPNIEMKQPDEKLQLNRFLGEWLNFCLQFGQSHTANTTHLAFLQ